MYTAKLQISDRLYSNDKIGACGLFKCLTNRANGRLLHGSQTLPGVGLPIIRRRYVRRTQGLGLLRGLSMHFLQSVMEPSSAPPGQKKRTEQPEAKSRV